MQETVWIMGSVAFFAAGIVYSVTGFLLRKNKRRGLKLSDFTGVAVGTFLAIAVLYFYGNRNAASGLVERLIMAILGTIRALTGENAVVNTREQLYAAGTQIPALFSFYTALLHFSASTIVIGAVYKVIADFFPMLRYVFLFKRKIYVFSSLTERGILLAEDIKNKNKKATIVFLNNESGTNTELLMSRAQEVPAYVFAYEIEELWTPFSVKEIEYFLLKDNHDENVKEALGLARKCQDKALRIHILNDSQETIELLETVKSEKCVFRLINEAKLTVYNMLDKKPLFLTPENQSDILIIGAGKNGQAALKACSWCGYTLKRTPNIYVVDKAIAPKQKLEKEAPAMMSEGNISYLTMDVESPEFLGFLREHLLCEGQKIGYVFCNLGDDHLNLQTAMDVRRISYEGEPFGLESGKLPYINVLMEEDFLANAAKELSFEIGDKKRRSYELNPYGGLKAFYTWENICASKLEGAGLAVDLHYWYVDSAKENRDSFYEDNCKKSNYNLDSSIANGLHAKYKMYALLQESGCMDYMSPVDWEQELDDSVIMNVSTFMNKENGDTNKEVVEALAKVEHLRWNAYMYSEGWKKESTTDWKLWSSAENLAIHKNFGAKLHACLVSWEELAELHITKIGKEKEEDFQEYDRALVRATGSIIENAKHYGEKLLTDAKF